MSTEENSNVMETGEAKPQKSEEEAKDDGPNVLDLAFAMDCTGSMGSYIDQARQNIRTIVEDIVSSEKADVHLALVEYRDHPPQDSSFVTKVHDFTPSVKQMKGWLDKCSASGGGDGPEAVADALHQVLKLNWRDEAAKICVFISDAPPHGLSSSSGDGFPNGCPDGLDPMVTANEIGEKGITMYMVGCEPSISPYRDWFMAVAQITNGQYVPLTNSTFLSSVIIGGAKEEIALQRLLETVNRDVVQEAQMQGADLDEEALTKKVHARLQCEGHRSNQLRMNNKALEGASSFGMVLSKHKSMASVKADMDKHAPPSSGHSRMRMAPSSKRASSTKCKKKSGSFSLFNALGFGGSSKESDHSEVDEDDDDNDHASCESYASERSAAPATPATPTSWNVAEDEIQIEQSRRLVSRAMKMNKFK